MERLARDIGGRKPYSQCCSRQRSRIDRAVREKFVPSLRTKTVDVLKETSYSESFSVGSMSLASEPLVECHSATETVSTTTCCCSNSPTHGFQSIQESNYRWDDVLNVDSVRTLEQHCNSSSDESVELSDYDGDAMDDDVLNDDSVRTLKQHCSLSSDESVELSDYDGDAMDDEPCNVNAGSSTFREKLASCFIENRISHRTGDSILALLRSHPCFETLPKSTKTLLQTPRAKVTLIDVPPGKYLHLGFENAIVRILEGIQSDKVPSALEIDISTDGAIMDDSGNNDIWPIQCRGGNVNNSVIGVIGIYRGGKKPHSAMDFLGPFVTEANRIIGEGGIMFSGKKISITLRAIIADAPARAFILNHMAHNSFSPCSKCKVVGESVDRRMTYRGIDHPLRTDEDYHKMVDEDHHKEGVSPLSLLPIGLVTQTPFEYMHLVCLGVMKRILAAWISGKFSIETKLSGREIQLITERLEHLKNKCPREFARRPRGIEFYHKYKATEFRQLLLYTGPVVFEGIVKEQIFTHFLLLHASMRILACKSPSKAQLVFAEQALKIFVLRSEQFYGAAFVSYNVHGLLHIVDDVKLFGPVDSYSAFPYENNMKLFAKYCRRPGFTLQQIAKRLGESAKCGSKDVQHRHHNDASVALFHHSNGPLSASLNASGITQYRSVKGSKFTLDTTERDRCCITLDGSICLVYNVVVLNEELYFVVRQFGSVASLFEVGVSSPFVGYYKCSALSQELLCIRFCDVSTKGYLMPHWSPQRFDESGKELVIHGEFIVGAMSCATNY